jgi:hypothetical protein
VFGVVDHDDFGIGAVFGEVAQYHDMGVAGADEYNAFQRARSTVLAIRSTSASL